MNIPTNCVNCHTTTPDWKPATFDIHNNYYQLIGAHAAIRDNCAICHNGNYNNTPNTCVGCHQQDYNQTTNPNHSSAQFLPIVCSVTVNPHGNLLHLITTVCISRFILENMITNGIPVLNVIPIQIITAYFLALLVIQKIVLTMIIMV